MVAQLLRVVCTWGTRCSYAQGSRNPHRLGTLIPHKSILCGPLVHSLRISCYPLLFLSIVLLGSNILSTCSFCHGGTSIPHYPGIGTLASRLASVSGQACHHSLRGHSECLLPASSGCGSSSPESVKSSAQSIHIHSFQRQLPVHCTYIPRP